MAGAVAPARRRLHPALRLSLLLLGLCALLALVELAFRRLWTPPAWVTELQLPGLYATDAGGDVVLQPGFRGAMPAGGTGGGTAVAIDALGLRGPEPGAKLPEERRVLVVGDSLVWGPGVDAAQAFPARWQERLRAAGQVVTVGNGGVPGHGASHMARHLARVAPAFGADAFVVCGHLGSDPLDDAWPQQEVFAGLLLRGPWAVLVRQSWRARLACRSRAALWCEGWLERQGAGRGLLAGLRLPLADAERAAGFTPLRVHAGLFLDVVDANTQGEAGVPPLVPRQLAALGAALAAMRETAGDRPLVFVILPTSLQVLEERRLAGLRQLGWEPAAFERGLAQQRWRTVAKEVGMRALDATPILAAAPDPAGLFLPDGTHLTARGHEVLAAWLHEELGALRQ